MQTGEALISDVEAAQLAPGQVAFWWLGQHSFIVKMGRHVVYLDPFLTPLPERLVPSLVTCEQTAHATLILGSHDHGDHIDRDAWPDMARASSARFVVPDLVRQSIVTDLDIADARVLGVDDGTRVDVDGARITGVAAAHEFFDRDPASDRYPYLGFVIEADGAKVYHAGDTCVYDGLAARLKRLGPFDVALLPINGRDAVRYRKGWIGNMTYQEAVDLAGTIQPRLTVPTHYDMFEGNTEDPNLFVDYISAKYPALKTHVCDYGQRVVVEAASAE